VLLVRDEVTARERRRQEQEWRSRREGGFQRSQNAYASYGAQLRAFARQITRILEAFQSPEGEGYSPSVMAHLEEALSDYAEATEPWARATAARMLTEVDRRDRTAWRLYSEGMGAALREELNSAPTGDILRSLLDYQVQLITSLPREAGQRVHEKTLQALETGARYPEQTAEIEDLLREARPDATKTWLFNRATLIARTETARTASLLTQSRAVHIGSEQYQWVTAGDARVRPSHRKLNRRVFNWDDPPLSDPPDYHSHPGQIFNCRCVALPLIPE
jgi:SPP1 gp7 family putative phage head morphogenesis protein